VLDIIVFVALGLLLTQMTDNWRGQPNKITAIAIGGVVAGALIIAGFYIRGVI
ncbi:MAG: hypothetical protein HY056_09260, partial [Proteobacteria bacterium]|nr:hypothetical protein [Pseudomonadota bacterium]